MQVVYSSAPDAAAKSPPLTMWTPAIDRLEAGAVKSRGGTARKRAGIN